MIGKKYFIPIVVAIVMVVSCFGVLDEYSDNYTTDSIIGAGTSYAIARAINAGVSVLQTTTVEGKVKGVGASLTIGEMLDPVNDLIERFSHVMSIALGSLILQKVLLEISAHAVFKLLIGVFGFILIAAFFTKNIGVISWASKIFLLLIFVRFSLVTVVSFNSIVDYYFIDNQITSGTHKLNEFSDNVAKLENDKITFIAYEKSIDDDIKKIDYINTIKIPSIELELEGEKNALIKAESALGEIQNRMDWEDRWNPFLGSMDVADAKENINLHEQQIDGLESDLEEQEEKVEQLRKSIEESKKRLAGEPVGMLETISDMVGLDYVIKVKDSVVKLKDNLTFDAIEDGIIDAADNVINLSVLFILKTILIPLAFFFVFIRVLKGIWNADWTNTLSAGEELIKD